MMRELLAKSWPLLLVLLTLGCARGVDPAPPAQPPAPQPPAASEAAPIPPPPGPAALLARAGREAVDPVFFLTATACNLPNFVRPVRALWRLLTLPVHLLDPVDSAFDLVEVPGDLWAPVKGAAAIVCATPKLLGPLRAVVSLAQAVAAAFRGAPEPPADAPAGSGAP